MVEGSICGVSNFTAKAPTAPAMVPNSRASQRLPLRKPRSSAKRFCSVYSGMKR